MDGMDMWNLLLLACNMIANGVLDSMEYHRYDIVNSMYVVLLSLTI